MRPWYSLPQANIPLRRGAMTVTKLAYIIAVVVPGGFALLTLALALRLYVKKQRPAEPSAGL